MTDTAAPAAAPNEAKRIEGLLDVLNPGDRVLVYRVVIDPATGKETRPIKANLTEFQGVEDLEAWLYDMAAEQHWPAGEYILDHRKAGVHGSHCRAKLSLDPPPAPASPATNGAPPTALELVKQAREIVGATARPEASPDKVLESVTAAMRVGADAASAKAPASDATAVLLKPVLEALVARLAKDPAPAPPPPDPWAFLERLEKMGLLGQKGEAEKPVPLVEQIGEIEQLVDALGKLRGPGGPAAEPTAIAVAKVLAPYIPQVLATVNNVVDVIRVRLGTAGPFMGQPHTPTATAPRAVGPPVMPPAMQQLIARTQAAIQTDDDSFFPGFAEGVSAHVVDGQNFLLAVQRGQIEEEQALAAVQGTGLLNPADPRTRGWLIRFVHWLRAAQPVTAAPAPAAGAPAAPPAPSNPLEVAARCAECGQEYRFDSREQFDRDTRICDVEIAAGELCKGNIVLLPAEGGAA